MLSIPKKSPVLGWRAHLLFFSILVLLSCKQSQKDLGTITGFNPAFASYISSYTTGVISSGSTIRILLSEPFGDSSIAGRESEIALFQMDPAVKGTTFWLDNQTVEFRPATRLVSGQLYEVSFALSTLFKVPPALSTFTFPVQVLRQDFELNVENSYTIDHGDLTKQRLEGLVLTADFGIPEQVEQVLQVTQSGKDLPVTWTHSQDGLEHRFLVDQIIRQKETSEVQVQVNGAPLGIVRSKNMEVEIPALGDFKLMDARVMSGSNQHVILRFSDPIKTKQNLNGLIRIGQLSDLQFSIQDHEILVYPNVRQTDSLTLYLDPGIQNILDYRLKEAVSVVVRFDQLKPAVRFTGRGNILPAASATVLPFEAVGLKAIDVEVIKIFAQNMLQFLQANQLDGSNELRRVGKIVLKKMIKLDESGITDFGQWNRYTLDLKELVQTEPGAMYQIRISFNRNYSTYFCENQPLQEDLAVMSEAEIDDDQEASYWDSYDSYFYNPDYDWQERDNPCHSSYYDATRRISKNILASDLGIIAKRGEENSLQVFVSSISTALPLSNVKVEVFNFQRQWLIGTNTDAEGKVDFRNLPEKPFVLLVSHEDQRGYLRLDEGSSLSLSAFDVSGATIQKGIKGFIYGDRGVWRPGDSLHLSFILEDKNNLLPDDHPVIFELSNPQSQLVDRQVRTASENGIYYFGTITQPEAITGNYHARITVGGTTFSQTVKVETVKPNRLKIQFELESDKILSGKNNLKGNLDVRWLHGAPARNLLAEFDVLLSRSTTGFSSFRDYSFEDPTSDFYSEPIQVIKQRLDDNGHLNLLASLDNQGIAPGVLNATFRGKVFEEGGDFSVDRFTVPFYPYPAFIGIRTPSGDKARGQLLTDTLHRIEIVRVDPEGGLTGNGSVEVEVHKLQWTWWWENTGNNLANYVGSSQSEPLQKETVKLNNGRANWTFQIDYPDWGRYLIRVCDPVSGHCSGKIVYVDWPGWAGRDQRDGAEGATMLMFSSDKPSYKTGEEALLQIPGSAGSRALISIENGSRMIQSWWIPTQAGDTPFRFIVTPEMTPNVYVHITLIQEHAQSINDLPLRLYGVIPLTVEDPKTHLKPRIKMANQLEPGKEVVIQISEEDQRKMSYTLAVVDEGLLDLTRFKTPDPWNRFYAKEALGVRTWDLYDQIIGAYGTTLERLLAVGGDESLLIPKESDARAQRFKPVVKFMGPFTLEKGKSNTHKFTMPPYIGSVKTMVVAAFEGAYGHAEQVSSVKQPLMVLGTLPRVLGPQEKLTLPVTLFAGDASIKEAKVEVRVSGPLTLDGTASRQVSFSGKTDQTIDFALSVGVVTGIGKVTIVATSGSHRAEHEIEVGVRHASIPVTRVIESTLEAGQTWNTAVEFFGITGSNTAVLEVSGIPPINLDDRMAYLLTYPHGCLEQITSGAFPQLYLPLLRNLAPGESLKIQEHIKTAIQKLVQLQHRDGGFAYWPGADQSDLWSTTYAGHFLIEAANKGFVVPVEVLRKWKRFQKSKVSEWRKNPQQQDGELQQAYRLYALALSGAPENGAMNRLRESPDLQKSAAWMLSAAYAAIGQKDAALQLINRLNTQVENYEEIGDTYGSALRDQAIILETLTLLGQNAKGLELLKEISKALSNQNFWMSTQTTAFCLKAVASFTAQTGTAQELVFNYALGGSKSKEARTSLPVATIPLALNDQSNQTLMVQNASKGILFVRMMVRGIPTRDMQEEAIERNLRIQVVYKDMKGALLDVRQVEQGVSFYSEVSVQHLGFGSAYKNLALSQIFPSGWEISHSRLDEIPVMDQPSSFDYQDIRDDRVLTYFGLNPGQRKSFKILLTAAYTGSFYLPGTYCEAMYDQNVQAKSKGLDIQVLESKMVF